MNRITPAMMALLLTGCASQNLRLDTAGQDLASITPWQTHSETAVSTAAVEVTSLNDLVHIPQLDQLIGQTLANNPSLQQQTVGLDILARHYDIRRGAQLPLP